MRNSHFRDISRRSFLRFATAGGVAWSFHPPCLAAESDRLRKLSFLVISDTHLGYRDTTSAEKQWEKTAKEIAKLPEELVLHLGDVVDGGREPQYPIYLKIREQIKKPLHEIPGNHDPQDLFEKYLRKPVDTTVDHHWLRFLLLNNSRTDSHDGFLSADQLKWIEEQCQKAEHDRKFVAICLHVPAHSNKHPDRGWYVKPDNGQTELYRILKSHQNRILCLMHGHFHNGVRGWDDHAPIQEICFPSVLYNRDRRLEQQNAPGYNLPEFRPGYTHVTIENQTMRLEYQPVGEMKSTERNQPLTQLG